MSNAVAKPGDIFTFAPVEQCMLCGSAEQHEARGVAWAGVPFSYVICGRCGLKYMNPRPTPESYARFYADAYWQGNMSGQGFRTTEGYDDPTVDQMKLRMPKYQAVYRNIKRDITSIATPTANTRILEVGCAFGYSLEWLHRDFGCQVFGIEPSHESRKRHESAGAIKLVGYLAEDAVIGKTNIPAEEKYDWIFFSHVLETLPDPQPVLRGCREFLKDDGILLLYVPNVEYYDAMAPICPFIYSPETLGRLLQVCGFDVVRIDAPPSPVSKEIAVRVVNPSYHMVAFARRGAIREVPAPQVDPVAVARTHLLGNTASRWSELTVGEMLLRVRLRLAEKASRAMGGSHKR